jgi:hypothetical protein
VNGAIAYAILKNITRIEDATLLTRDILVQILEAVLTNVVFSSRLSEGFTFLSAPRINTFRTRSSSR